MPIGEFFAPETQNNDSNLKIECKSELTYQRQIKCWSKSSSSCLLWNGSSLGLRSIKSTTLFKRRVESNVWLMLVIRSLCYAQRFLGSLGFQEASNKLTIILIILKRKFPSYIEKDPKSRRKNEENKKKVKILKEQRLQQRAYLLQCRRRLIQCKEVTKQTFCSWLLSNQRNLQIANQSEPWML